MLEVLGIGLVKITFEEIESEDYSSEVFYQIGIGMPMIQNILHLHIFN